MLDRVEPAIRALLEHEEVNKRVALWVAGGSEKEDRARRAEVALFAHARVTCEGWPALWILHFFSEVDAAASASRRARGLRRLTVEETCAEAKVPDASPPPTRRTKKEREAAAQMTLAEHLHALAERVEEAIKAK